MKWCGKPLEASRAIREILSHVATEAGCCSTLIERAVLPNTEHCYGLAYVKPLDLNVSTPLYCFNDNGVDCSKPAGRLREHSGAGLRWRKAQLYDDSRAKTSVQRLIISISAVQYRLFYLSLSTLQ